MTQSPVAIIGLTQLFRESLEVLLRGSRFMVTVKAETIGAALIDFETKRPELAVVAISSNNRTEDWIDHLRSNRPEFEGVRIVLLTDDLTSENIPYAAAAGVSAILSNDITGDVFLRSLELVLLGQQVFPCFPDQISGRPLAALIPFSRAVPKPLYNEAPAARRPHDVKGLNSETQDAGCQRSTALSERERQILRCLVEGAANKTIARDLMITEATVKVHIKGLLRKIRVSNRTQAAVWGLNNRTLLNAPSPALQKDSRSIPPSRQVAS